LVEKTTIGRADVENTLGISRAKANVLLSMMLKQNLVVRRSADCSTCYRRREK